MKKALAVALSAALAASVLPMSVFAEEDRPEITLLVPEYNAGKSLKNEHADEVIAAYEDYTNTTATIKWGDNGAYNEILGTTLMDSDIPMILTIQGALDATIVDAANQDMFWDLSDYLDDYPNLATIAPAVRANLSVNGMVIGIPRVRELGRYGMSYRKDWAEKLGFTEDPQTPDEVYAMLDAFTHQDPDGNGKDDTYGFEMTKYTGPFDIVQTWFGCGNGWVENEEGNLIPVHQQPEYMEALDWLKKLYDEGIMRKDWYEIDTSEWSNGCKKGENGMFVDVMDSGRRIWDYFVNNEVPSVVNPDEYASMRLQGPVGGRTLATSGYNGFYVITKDGAQTEEDLRNCLNFLDKLNDYDMRLLADYGLEGVTYEINADGLIDQTNFAMESSETPHLGLNQMVSYTYDEANTPAFPVFKSERQEALEDCYYNRTRPVAISNPALPYIPSSEVYSSIGSELDSIISEARSQYIIGVLDKEGLQERLDYWATAGGNDLIAEINELYHAAQADAGEAEVETETAAE